MMGFLLNSKVFVFTSIACIWGLGAFTTYEIICWRILSKDGRTFAEDFDGHGGEHTGCGETLIVAFWWAIGPIWLGTLFLAPFKKIHAKVQADAKRRFQNKKETDVVVEPDTYSQLAEREVDKLLQSSDNEIRLPKYTQLAEKQHTPNPVRPKLSDDYEPNPH
jgi:hypothetical protein